MGRTAESIEAWLKALPGASDLLFWPPPKALYTVAKLYAGYNPGDPASWRKSWDARVYAWTLDKSHKPRALDDVETAAARLHDAAMDRLVRAYIDPAHDQATIGFMGGHDIPRTEAAYARVAHIARELRRWGFKIVTGGGPGLMEAANLGAFLAPHADEAFDATLKTLRAAPDYGSDPDPAIAEQEKCDWVHTAALARTSLVGSWNAPPLAGGDSLGIPTWYYGSEPPNLFASASGKYFMNSLREDGLVSLANGGLVFGKGAAGTVQEVFQNASYNYYRGAGVDATPMVFLDIDFWNPGPATDAAAGAPLDPKRKPVFPLVQKLAADANPSFTTDVMLSNDADDIIEFLASQNARRINARQAEVRLKHPNAMPSPRRP